MANLGKIVYLSEAQKDELFTNGSVTSNGTTIEYSQNDLYVTPDTNVEDVKVGGVSVVNNNSANIPVASSTSLGVIMLSSGTAGGIQLVENRLVTRKALSTEVKSGAYNYNVIVPSNQHESVFYGLTKAAGIDMAASSNSVGTYTDAAKDAIQNMLGVSDLLSTRESSTATAAHAANSLFLMDGKLHKATAAIGIGDAVAAGTNCQVVKADEVFVKNTDIASYTQSGIVKTYSNYGTYMNGDYIRTYLASSDDIKAGTQEYRPIVPKKQHESIFYGLSKVAGVDLASETVTLGTYPETSKTAIRTMISAISNTDYASSSTGGVVKINEHGLTISSGVLSINPATDSYIKGANANYMPIVPASQHKATFYGLAKAAGDTTMSSSSNEIGTYTSEAKAAIQSMLGVEKGVELIETITGTTPSITAQPNVIYQCGEVSTISITPPANGTCDIFFTSGSTATVLTIPNTVKFPEWFDATALETDTIYEIMITNGAYGRVMTWAAT